MNVLIWHVHGSWTTAFLQGDHTYLLPVTPGRDPDGRGRARTWRWPDSAVEVPLGRLADHDVDVAVLQRPHEEELLRRFLGRKVPLVYLEHDAPWGEVPLTRHPMADRRDVLLVHVTHFNDLFWDSGSTERRVVEHAVLDPGALWSGELPRAGVVVNEPLRRGRYAGTDLLGRLAGGVPVDVFGMKVTGLPEALGLAEACTFEDLPQGRMHELLACRRVYLHPFRWTSLGLSLIEAMYLGMPVVALAATEAVEAVPPGAGVVSTNPDVLAQAVRRLVHDRDEAAALGKAGREAALDRYGLCRFLADWDVVLREAVAR
ncbi:glycosyltransferase [Actinocorallia populi]|uniref:glycosyltransferase n=1 Tax=Actinocorallia populi TaxID=2079200 RepID=UPI000D08BF05|nr:glycosyltransferase [Actinocorallia populi]